MQNPFQFCIPALKTPKPVIPYVSSLFCFYQDGFYGVIEFVWFRCFATPIFLKNYKMTNVSWRHSEILGSILGVSW